MGKLKKTNIKITKIKKNALREYIIYEDSLEKDLISQLEKRIDTEADRIKKLLSLPDLTKKENSPVKFIVEEIIESEQFKDFDIVEIPRIVPVQNNFDLLNTPLSHPSRRGADTYYLNNDYVLRTHTTTMWSYYLADAQIIERLEKNEILKCLCTGIVYRKDEIDRDHYPAFHHIDGLYIGKKDTKIIAQEDLEKVLVGVANIIFGSEVECKFIPDTFPFTDSSIEMQINWQGRWLEVLGAGLVHNKVLENFNLDPSVYNGWAFGFGLDRLAMLKNGIPDIRILWSNDKRITSQFKDINSQYKEVSKYPATNRDISFVIDKNVSLNNYYEIVRECGGDVVEEVELLDKYENPEKFDKDKISYTFRIVYRSPERTLESEEVNKIQEEIRQKTVRELKAILR